MYLSLIIPVYNEKDNILPIVNQIKSALTLLDYEIIFVDDGSKDGTVEEILTIKDANIKLVKFIRNFGQTSAMAAGIEVANGEFIATLDGDLQNDPSDIPLMLDKLIKEDLDLVTGVRRNRMDRALMRKFPSRVANFIIRNITNVHIEDYGCTLKVFRSNLAKSLDLYGELHRFIPILANINGAKIGQMDVKHHQRIYGNSKYGIGRTTKVVSDLLLMYFFQKYRQKPIHLFGNLAIPMFAIGSLIEIYMLLLKIMGNSIGSRPLFYVGILLIIAAIQLMTTGFLAELIMRTYFGAQNKKPYIIDKIYDLNPQAPEKVEDEKLDTKDVIYN